MLITPEIRRQETNFLQSASDQALETMLKHDASSKLGLMNKEEVAEVFMKHLTFQFLQGMETGVKFVITTPASPFEYARTQQSIQAYDLTKSELKESIQKAAENLSWERGLDSQSPKIKKLSEAIRDCAQSFYQKRNTKPEELDRSGFFAPKRDLLEKAYLDLL